MIIMMTNSTLQVTVLVQLVVIVLSLLLSHHVVHCQRLDVFHDKLFHHAKIRDVPVNEKWRIVQDEYIVVFDDSFFDNNHRDDVIDTNESSIQDFIHSSGARIQYIYQTTFKGMSIRSMPVNRMLLLLDKFTNMIKYVTPNVLLVADEQREQVSPPWGLDRIDQETRWGNQKFKYSYDGSEVSIYIVDSGIHLSHEEFSGRATCGFTAFEDDNCSDGYGHGTHVAGIAGGKTYGVAKNASLVAVKVLNNTGSGKLSYGLAGIEYVTVQKKNSPKALVVMNMSFSTNQNTLLNDAVTAAIDSGVVSVVSAGNIGSDSCQFSPASTKNAITVGSTTRFDFLASFSNVGTCVDVFAPGINIVSAYPDKISNTQKQSLTGTSMSAPFVAGVAALHLQKNPNLSPAQVWSAIQTDAAKGKIRFLFDQRGSPNLLVNMGSLK